ncbi:MAG: hypothetical protein QXQ40_00075 [Candidatus Aenigmatarchaeota archaeon]
MQFFKKDKKEEEIKDTEEPEPTIQISPKPEDISAPLFVKVDKYKEALLNLQEIKTLLNGLKNIFSILEEMEQVKNDAINTLRVTLQRVEKSVIELDSGLLRPADVKLKIEIEETPETKAVEDSLMELYNQLNTIRAEIEKAKG